jgi:hypothetical protein
LDRHRLQADHPACTLAGNFLVGIPSAFPSDHVAALLQ